MASTSKVTRLNIKMYFDISYGCCFYGRALGNCEMGIFKFIPSHIGIRTHSHSLTGLPLFFTGPNNNNQIIGLHLGSSGINENLLLRRHTLQCVGIQKPLICKSCCQSGGKNIRIACWEKLVSICYILQSSLRSNTFTIHQQHRHESNFQLLVLHRVKKHFLVYPRHNRSKNPYHFG